MEIINKGVTQFLISKLYDTISVADSNNDMRVLNYGFDNGREIPMSSEDRSHYYRLALYHHVASAIDLSGKDVLEVGSGRGGGASYIARHFNPRSMQGLDLSSKAVRFCQGFYKEIPNLAFGTGDAEALELEDGSCDVLINIESSHNYSNMGEFVSEAHRVLRPEGHFLLADMRIPADLEILKKMLSEAGFGLISEEDITQNVLSALDKDNDRKVDFIKYKFPRTLWFLQKPFSAFAGVKGTHIYNKLQTGELCYINIVSQKI